MEGALELRYCDQSGNPSVRRILARELKVGPGKTLLGGIDMADDGYRGFRADRIDAIVDAETGSVIDRNILDWLIKRARAGAGAPQGAAPWRRLTGLPRPGRGGSGAEPPATGPVLAKILGIGPKRESQRRFPSARTPAYGPDYLDRALAAACSSLQPAPVRHRRHGIPARDTYYPKLCLIQIASTDEPSWSTPSPQIDLSPFVTSWPTTGS